MLQIAFSKLKGKSLVMPYGVGGRNVTDEDLWVLPNLPIYILFYFCFFSPPVFLITILVVEGIAVAQKTQGTVQVLRETYCNSCSYI